MQIEVYKMIADEDTLIITLEAICDSFSSLLWDIEYYDCGRFEVYIAIQNEINSMTAVKNELAYVSGEMFDNYVLCMRDVMHYSYVSNSCSSNRRNRKRNRNFGIYHSCGRRCNCIRCRSNRYGSRRGGNKRRRFHSSGGYCG